MSADVSARAKSATEANRSAADGASAREIAASTASGTAGRARRTHDPRRQPHAEDATGPDLLAGAGGVAEDDGEEEANTELPPTLYIGER